MKTTGTGLVADIAQADSFPEDPGLGHFSHLVLQRHGTRAPPEDVIQGAVMLAVEIFLPISVGDLHGFPRACVILVIGIIKMDDAPTAFPAGIVPVISGMTEGCFFIPGIIIPVDSLVQ